MLQRALPDAASDFFLRLWGSGKGARLVRPAALCGCAWLDENQVTNPDGVELPYLFHIPASDQEGGSTERWLWPRTVIDPAAVISTDLEAPKPNSPGGVFMGCAVEMERIDQPADAADATAAMFRPVFAAEQAGGRDHAAVSADPSAVPVYSDLDELLSPDGDAGNLFPVILTESPHLNLPLILT